MAKQETLSMGDYLNGRDTILETHVSEAMSDICIRAGASDEECLVAVQRGFNEGRAGIESIQAASLRDALGKIRLAKPARQPL